jgi:HK97 family phage major capsid protein
LKAVRPLREEKSCNGWKELQRLTDKKVFYVVNLYALVKFFDRKTYEIATSKEAGFTYNQTFVRCIERFDAVKGDDRACFKIEF